VRPLIAFLSSIGNTRDEFVQLAKTYPAVEKMFVSFVLKEKQRAEGNFVGLTGGTMEERAKTFT
jgi:hypothetical protein